MAVLIFALSSSPVLAIDDYDFFSGNDILFYSLNDYSEPDMPGSSYCANPAINYNASAAATSTPMWETQLAGPYNVEDYIVEVLRDIALKLNLPESDVLTEQHVLALTAFGYGEGGNIANVWTFNLFNTAMRGGEFITLDGQGNVFEGSPTGTHGFPTFSMGVEATAQSFIENVYQTRLISVLSNKNSTAEDFMYTLTHFEDYPDNLIWAEQSDANNDGIGDDEYYNERISLVSSVRSRYSEIASYLMGPPGYTSGQDWAGNPTEEYHSLTRPLRYSFEGQSSDVTVNLPNNLVRCSNNTNGSLVGPIGNLGSVVVSKEGYAFPVVGVTSRGPYKPGHDNRDAADILANPGTPIVAIASGELKYVTVNFVSDGGNIGCAGTGIDASRDSLQIWGDDGYIYFYTHMAPNSTVTAGISTGMRIEAGTLVGTVGPRGADDCSVPHLHISATPQSSSSSIDRYDGDWLWKNLLPSL